LDVKKSLKTASPTAMIRVPILFYHYVENVADKRDTIRQSLNIPPHIFEAQIKTLTDAGFTFLTAEDLANILDGIKALPEKPVLITFDDGHWDLATDIMPILAKYKAHATAYIISGFIGRSDFLSEAQLKQVIQSGLVEIGAHTVHHIALAKNIQSTVIQEITESKQILQKNYGVRVVSFAYPDGSFDNQAIAAVTAAGYRTAVSTLPGIEQNQNNRFFLNRLRPGDRTGEMLLKYLAQNTFKPW
jgi:peptidoglycan/xylan/chitin deacetylase (PgdA/CDA1 family)